MSLHDVAGSIGVALIVGAYLLLQLDRLQSNAYGYLVANAVGAALILLSLAFEFNLSAALMELIWLLISIFGIARRLLEARNSH